VFEREAVNKWVKVPVYGNEKNSTYLSKISRSWRGGEARAKKV